ncbi:MAG TPA: hypothetical protein VM869_33205, partial [Enhygromyxa sp.]|nr:hypothetical protein [Enhygromyxa sp.]
DRRLEAAVAADHHAVAGLMREVVPRVGDQLGVEVVAPAFGMTGQVLEFEGATWLRIGGSKDARLRSSHAEILADALIDLAEAQPLTLLFEGPRAYANLRSFARACAMALGDRDFGDEFDFGPDEGDEGEAEV